MSLAEAKQLFGTLILGSTAITIAILYIAYKFAEISYRKAHKAKKAICFMTVGKNEKAFKYLIEQYEIIKKDLSDNDQEDRQINIKIF